MKSQRSGPDGSPLVPPQHASDLFPEGPPGASPVMAGRAAYLHIGHGPLAPRMDVGGLDGTPSA